MGARTHTGCTLSSSRSSVHPNNGNSLVTAGLDCCVRAWDLRKLCCKRTPQPVASYDCGRSVTSAFYTCTGRSLICTTMADRLEILEGGKLTLDHSFRHDNKTGRWLTTLQAIPHPTIDDLFAVGSMAKPRCVELFSLRERIRAVRGEALTAVVSRLAFHPRSDEGRILLAGGNSSGRVTIVQSA